MKRTTGFGAAVVLGGTLLAGAALTRAADKDDDTPTVKQIMTKVNKGPKSLHQQIEKALKGDPNWDDMAKQTKEYAKLCACMARNAPPQGEKDSWAKLTKQYGEDSKALDEAVAKKDKTAVAKAHKKLNESCTACHNAHKE
jgi:hypothetical protein